MIPQGHSLFLEWTHLHQSKIPRLQMILQPLCQDHMGFLKMVQTKIHALWAANYHCIGYIVMPVAVETMGSWAPMALKFIQAIGTRVADVTGEKRSTSFLFQSIGIAIQRGNAASVAGTVPSTKQLEEVYYL